jgi:predicted ATPase/DNA-binding SARP family transcriptional activator
MGEMSPLALSLLGPLEMSIGDDPLDHLRVRSAQALLIYLAVEARPQQREFLVELLWPGMPLNYGRKNLRQTLYELRRAIPTTASRAGGEPVPLIIADRQTITINPQAVVNLDTAEFERLIQSGVPLNLERAVGLYRGDFLVDFYLPDSSSFAEWTTNRRAAYHRQMLDGLDRLADLALSVDNNEKAEQFARHQLALDDLREPAVRQLMVALARQDQRHVALQAYGELRERLREALDVEPAEETTALFKRIQEETVARPLVTEEPVGFTGENKEPATSAHNLPSLATPFIGRTRELEEIEKLMLAADRRLITLLGPGGVGKSRLALETASRLSTMDQFPDGIWFVPLAAFEEVEQILPAVAAPLPFDFYGSLDPERQLLDYLCDKQLVLLLDNMEQLLVSGPPELLQAIIAQAPGVKILATSRAPLHIQGEQLYRVAGLMVPSRVAHPLSMDAVEWARQSDAVQLYESCARRVDPDFSLDEGNIDAVLGIGQYVEGFPLGLEMAAAWIELLSPAEIEKELAKSFDLLEDEWTFPSDRHHSARAVFEWSWRLLTVEERALCQALSVFRGGFNREAALSVGQAALPALLRLSRKSWLQQDGSGRYHLHELLRQYAEEKLREDEKALQAATASHAAYFISYFERLNQMAHGRQQQEAFEAIERDVDNARIAWHWLLNRGRYADVTTSLLPALFTSAIAKGQIVELQTLIETTRDRLYAEDGGEEAQTAALALNAAQCKLDYDNLGGDIHGEVTVPWQLLQESWKIVVQEPAGFTSGPWAILAATFYGWQQDREHGLWRLRRLVNYYRESNDRWLYAFSLQSLGRLLSMQGTQPVAAAAITAEREDSRRRLDQALDLFFTLGDVLEQSRTLRWIGHMVRGEDPGTALVYYQKANSLLVGAKLPTTGDYAHLALSYLSLGEYEEAFRIFARERQYYEQQGNRALLVGVMSLESIHALRYGDIDHARDLRTACKKIQQELGQDINVIYSNYELGEIDRVSGQLQSARTLYEQALASFTGFNDSHGQAFCRRGLGDLALLNDDYQLARRHFEAALSLAKEPFVHSWLTLQTQTKLARAALCLGDIEGAKEYLDLAVWYAKIRISDSNDLLMITLAEKAAVLLANHECDRALALGTFVANHAASWHETKWRAGDVINAAAKELPSADSSAAEARGRQMTLAGALAFVGWD